MFRQLLTPVGESLPLSFIVAALPVLIVLVLARCPPAAGLAGFARGPRRRLDHRGRDLGSAGQPRRGLDSERRRVRAVAGDVDRRQCAPALQRRGRIEAVRRLPRLDPQSSAERPAHRARRDRILLRRPARRHRRLRHAGGDHVVAPDPGRISDAGSAGLRPDLQYGAGRFRRARRSGDGARRGDRPASPRCSAR